MRIGGHKQLFGCRRSARLLWWVWLTAGGAVRPNNSNPPFRGSAAQRDGEIPSLGTPRAEKRAAPLTRQDAALHPPYPAETKDCEIEITAEIEKAGYRVLVELCLAEYPLEKDKLTLAEIY